MSHFPNYAQPLGFEQLSAFSAATGFTAIPAGTGYAMLTVSGEAVRYRSDGTAPTASVGVLLPINPGEPYQLAGGLLLANVKFIPVSDTATVRVTTTRSKYYGKWSGSNHGGIRQCGQPRPPGMGRRGAPPRRSAHRLGPPAAAAGDPRLPSLRRVLIPTMSLGHSEIMSLAVPT